MHPQQSKLLNFFAIIFGIIAVAAISSGSGQEEGAVPYATFPTNNTFFYDVPQEEVSPMCNADFGNSNDAAASSLTSPIKYLADYNFLSEYCSTCLNVPSKPTMFLTELS